MINKFFPPDFSLETPRILLEPKQRSDNEVIFSITDKHSKTVCGTASYSVPSDNKTIEITWEWFEPEETDQGLIKNLKFGMLSYAFEVMKVEKAEMKGEGSFFMLRSEWPATKEIFFPELL
jgi:RimJ/RimL family protein N-acetyltransferase